MYPESTSSAYRETWQLQKPAARGAGGVVVSQHYAASEVGAAVLADGGNAVDAALATSFAVSVCEPWMSGIGGCGSMLVYDASAMGGGSAATDQHYSIDFGVRAPQTLDPGDYPLTGDTAGDLFSWPEVVDNRNVYGPGSIAVPGYVRGVEAAATMFASRPWRELMAPAIALCREGMAVDWYASLKIASAARIINQFASTRSVYLDDQGLPPVGEWGGPLPRITLGNLGDTLEQLSHAGADDYYTGDIAASLLADAKALGCALSAADLAAYQTSIQPPLHGRYGGADIYAMPGLCAGPTLLDALQRVDHSGDVPYRPPYSDYADALVAAYAHRLATMGHNDSPQSPSCTTHICVADRFGNVVSLTQTLLSLFGSKVVLPNTGVLMNNGIMWFDPRPHLPNSLAAGKQPLANMCPALLRQGQSVSAIGASGGRRIMAAVMQMIGFIVDAKMTPEQAAHAPRVDVSGGDVLTLDNRLPPEVAATIGERHDFQWAPNGVYPALYACPSIAMSGDDGVATGAAYVASPWAYACAVD